MTATHNTIAISNLQRTQNLPKVEVVKCDELAFTPTNCQANALLKMQPWLETDDLGAFILIGSAGTGKTTIIKQVIEKAIDLGYKVVIACPTGKAAQRVKNQSGFDAQTAHSLVFTVVPIKGKADVNFVQKFDLDGDKTLFVFDEAGMIACENKRDFTSLFQAPKSLLDAICTYTKSGHKKNKILFVGDTNQLAAGTEESSMALCNRHIANKFNVACGDAQLVEVKRTTEDNPIFKLASNFKTTLTTNLTARVNCKYNHLELIPVYYNYKKLYEQLGADEVIALCPSNEKVNKFNLEIREHLFDTNGKQLVPGEKLRIIKNYDRNNMSLCNGDSAKLIEVNWASLEYQALKVENATIKIAFVKASFEVYNNNGDAYIITDRILLDTLHSENGLLPAATENAMCHLANGKNSIYRESNNYNDDNYLGALRVRYDYAQTFHTAQGNEWHTVFLNNTFFRNTKYAYTAITRAKHGLFTFVQYANQAASYYGNKTANSRVSTLHLR